MLAKVTRPDHRTVTFKYDALGRRIEKCFNNTTTRWIWDGNVPLHEWKEIHSEENATMQPVTTWVFEEGTFVPVAKLTEEKKLSIATNYMGTPEVMYDEQGEEIWSCQLNSYGKVRSFQGAYKTDSPFRYQGQYEDGETGLYYNRMRYYSPRWRRSVTTSVRKIYKYPQKFPLLLRSANINIIEKPKPDHHHRIGQS